MVELEIATTNSVVTRDSLEHEVLKHLEVQYEGEENSASLDEALASVVVYVVDNVHSIGVAIVANWLYDRLKKNAHKLWINGRSTPMEPDAIEESLAVALEDVDDDDQET